MEPFHFIRLGPVLKLASYRGGKMAVVPCVLGELKYSILFRCERRLQISISKQMARELGKEVPSLEHPLPPHPCTTSDIMPQQAYRFDIDMESCNASKDQQTHNSFMCNFYCI
ncbi:hypothetical protein CEXT_538671 [Caerostris extrusa]|uniref:Uncharacterized protein n=1 Tax=Caerostris extrusa TaxID=172846 RepID=A0AAV4Y6J7_CAEEX|nr:hypothetical protein CEXT_538671 [Caerostris extrusa]